MMQKSTIFTTIFRVKKCYFHYDFACVPLSLQYAKKCFSLVIYLTSSCVILAFFGMSGPV
jgi:hypothetical protein